jgi:glutamine amidotransferase
MILVVDYGMGNLRSVSKALEHFGARVKVSAAPDDIVQADKIVLPGVGAFGNAIRELENRCLTRPLVESVRAGKPFLGICLGLQLLLDESDESAGVRGLGLVEGKVRPFGAVDVKIPHMGWNSIHKEFDHPLLSGVRDGDFFYFVHSFYAVPVNSRSIAATCRYGQENFAAMLAVDTIFATQFHPEKSQEAGLKILKNFIGWKP